jgi:hypothetical protein
METEIYLDVNNEIKEKNIDNGNLLVIEEKKFQDNKKKLLKELGFNALATGHFSDEIMGLSPLTLDEGLMWTRYLPTRYSDYQFKDFVFSDIPTDILQLYKTCKEQRLFESYSIRTPEKQKSDPILIGNSEYKSYLLARWGESLLPIDKIKKIVRWRQFRDNGGLFTLILLSTILPFIWIMVSTRIK